jgi:hypothetical protein
MRKASFHIQYGRIVNEDGEGEVSKGQHEQCAKNLLWRLAVVVGLAGGAMGGGRTKSLRFSDNWATKEFECAEPIKLPNDFD